MVQWLGVRAPGSIPGRGTGSHMPQLRARMLQLRALMLQLKFPHAARKIEDPACRN